MFQSALLCRRLFEQAAGDPVEITHPTVDEKCNWSDTGYNRLVFWRGLEAWYTQGNYLIACLVLDMAGPSLIGRVDCEHGVVTKAKADCMKGDHEELVKHS